MAMSRFVPGSVLLAGSLPAVLAVRLDEDDPTDDLDFKKVIEHGAGLHAGAAEMDAAALAASAKLPKELQGLPEAPPVTEPPSEFPKGDATPAPTPWAAARPASWPFEAYWPFKGNAVEQARDAAFKSVNAAKDEHDDVTFKMQKAASEAETKHQMAEVEARSLVMKAKDRAADDLRKSKRADYVHQHMVQRELEQAAREKNQEYQLELETDKRKGEQNLRKAKDTAAIKVKNAMIEQDFSDRQRRLENARYDVERLENSIHQGIERDRKHRTEELRQAREDVREAELKADKDQENAHQQIVKEKNLGEKKISKMHAETKLQTQRYRATEEKIDDVRDVATHTLKDIENTGSSAVRRARTRVEERTQLAIEAKMNFAKAKTDAAAELEDLHSNLADDARHRRLEVDDAEKQVRTAKDELNHVTWAGGRIVQRARVAGEEQIRRVELARDSQRKKELEAEQAVGRAKKIAEQKVDQAKAMLELKTTRAAETIKQHEDRTNFLEKAMNAHVDNVRDDALKEVKDVKEKERLDVTHDKRAAQARIERETLVSEKAVQHAKLLNDQAKEAAVEEQYKDERKLQRYKDKINTKLDTQRRQLEQDKTAVENVRFHEIREEHKIKEANADKLKALKAEDQEVEAQYKEARKAAAKEVRAMKNSGVEEHLKAKDNIFKEKNDANIYQTKAAHEVDFSLAEERRAYTEAQQEEGFARVAGEGLVKRSEHKVEAAKKEVKKAKEAIAEAREQTAHAVKMATDQALTELKSVRDSAEKNVWDQKQEIKKLEKYKRKVVGKKAEATIRNIEEDAKKAHLEQEMHVKSLRRKDEELGMRQENQLAKERNEADIAMKMTDQSVQSKVREIRDDMSALMEETKKQKAVEVQDAVEDTANNVKQVEAEGQGELAKFYTQARQQDYEMEKKASTNDNLETMEAEQAAKKRVRMATLEGENAKRLASEEDNQAAKELAMAEQQALNAKSYERSEVKRIRDDARLALEKDEAEAVASQRKGINEEDRVEDQLDWTRSRARREIDSQQLRAEAAKKKATRENIMYTFEEEKLARRKKNAEEALVQSKQLLEEAKSTEQTTRGKKKEAEGELDASQKGNGESTEKARQSLAAAITEKEGQETALRNMETAWKAEIANQELLANQQVRNEEENARMQLEAEQERLANWKQREIDDVNRARLFAEEQMKQAREESDARIRAEQARLNQQVKMEKDSTESNDDRMIANLRRKVAADTQLKEETSEALERRKALVDANIKDIRAKMNKDVFEADNKYSEHNKAQADSRKQGYYSQIGMMKLIGKQNVDAQKEAGQQEVGALDNLINEQGIKNRGLVSHAAKESASAVRIAEENMQDGLTNKDLALAGLKAEHEEAVKGRSDAGLAKLDQGFANEDLLHWGVKQAKEVERSKIGAALSAFDGLRAQGKKDWATARKEETSAWEKLMARRTAEVKAQEER